MKPSEKFSKDMLIINYYDKTLNKDIRAVLDILVRYQHLNKLNDTLQMRNELRG